MQTEDNDKSSAVFFHTHSRLDNLLDIDEAILESKKHDSLSSIEALVWFAKKSCNDPNILVCDTDHPVHVLDRKGLERMSSYKPENIEQTINIISKGILERALILKKTSFSNNIITGVEVDILNQHGKLDVDPEVLSKLEITIASLHPSYWKTLNGSYPRHDQWINSMIKVSLNPHIDVLGHPFRNYLNTVEDDYDLRDWEKLADSLAKSGTAFEINSLDIERNSSEFWLQKKIVEIMLNSNVNLIFGLDFHEFNDYGAKLPKNLFIDIHNIKKFYLEGICSAQLLNQFENKNIINILKNLGITSDMFVNSTKEKLSIWRQRINK